MGAVAKNVTICPTLACTTPAAAAAASAYQGYTYCVTGFSGLGLRYKSTVKSYTSLFGVRSVAESVNVKQAVSPVNRTAVGLFPF